MPKGIVTGYKLTKETLRERIKEIEDRLKEMDRREKAMKELRPWLEKRGLTALDVLAIYRMMRPQRAEAPEKSKHPLQPKGKRRSLKRFPKNSVGRFYVSPGQVYQGNVKAIKYGSLDDQFVWGGKGNKKPKWFADHIKNGGSAEDMLIVRPVNGAAAPEA